MASFIWICPMYVDGGVKKIYALRALLSLPRPSGTVCMFPHGPEKIVSQRIDPDDEREPVQLDYPDRFCHTKVREVDAFERHVRGGKRCTATGEGKVNTPSSQLLPHGGIHPAFPNQPPDPPVEQESGEGVHTGRGGRPCGHDPVVLYHRAAMVDYGTFRVKRDALISHAEMGLVPGSVDKAGELDPVTRMECKNFVSKGCFEPELPLYSPLHLHRCMPVCPALYVHGDR